MKKQLAYGCTILLMIILVNTSCTPERPEQPEKENHPPIAKISADTINISLTPCGAVTDQVLLDGSASSDPDHDISDYHWRQLDRENPNLNKVAARSSVFGLLPGQYAFELSVFDAGGLSSKDTVWVNVTATIAEYELDLQVVG